MANQNTKRIGRRPVQKPVTTMDTLQDTWRVMKPFIKFSVGALKVIATGLIFIVKHIPKPEPHEDANRKNTKVIKIS